MPLAGEAHLLLDGIQDAPHVLIHLQALEQSSFTGKREERAWSLHLDPGEWGNSYPSPLLMELSLLLVTIMTPSLSLVTHYYRH